MRRRNYIRSRSRFNGRRESARRSIKFKTVFHRDLAAMNQVWRMLKQGAINAFGEIGRQY
tara:strand:+ start:140 stop:319 length:180 start_codon:yes stop_codon:yes gene_type:complete